MNKFIALRTTLKLAVASWLCLLSPQLSAEDLGKVALDAAARAAADIKVTAVAAGSLQQTLRLYGRVVPETQARFEARARFAGVVRQLSLAPGDQVTTGALLAQIESNDSLSRYAITAPFSGTVVEVRAVAGTAVAMGEPLLVIVDLQRLQAELRVTAVDVPKLRQGMPLRLSATLPPSAAAPTGEGLAVDHLLPSMEGGATAIVQLPAATAPGAGSFVHADVELLSTDVDLLLPSAALQHLEQGDVVFVETADGFTARRVTAGRSANGLVEIRDGLAAGERVATSRSFLLKSALLAQTAED